MIPTCSNADRKRCANSNLHYTIQLASARWNLKTRSDQPNSGSEKPAAGHSVFTDIGVGEKSANIKGTFPLDGRFWPFKDAARRSIEESLVKEFTSGKHVALVIRGLGGRSGGAERIYCELANILTENGYRVTCLFFDKKKETPFYHIDARAERINLYGPAKESAQKWKKISKVLPKKLQHRAEWEAENGFFVKQLRDYFKLSRPDIAISLMPPANTPVLLAANGTSVKVVPTNHNIPEQDYDNPDRWSKNPYDRKLRKKVLDFASAIHVLFPEFSKWFPIHLQSRIVAIPNYISKEFDSLEVVPPKEKLILGVGRLADVKNYVQLIRSWASIAADHVEWGVKIYGVGPNEKELKEEARRLGVEGSLTFGGHRADLVGEYARAAIFCHPAFFEGFGLAPAEALAMGTPVVCYADCPGVNQFVKDGYNGLAVKRGGDPDELALALRRLIENEDLRERLGRNAPDSVREFSITRYTEAWTALIERLVDE